MSLLYLDSFAHQSTARYQSANTSAGGFNNTSGLRVGPWRVKGLFKKAIAASSEVTSGVAFFWGAAASILTFYGDSGATSHVTMMVNSSGKIEVRRGGTGGTLLAAGTTTVPSATWFYVEARVTIADSGGIVQVRLNGSTTNEIDFVGDTKNGGTATTIDAVEAGTTANCSMADWYIVNNAGSVNTGWLGDTVVRALVPTADGDLSGLTGSDGNSVSNWQQVDDLPVSATDYNGSPTSGAEDTYNITDLPTNATAVKGVQVSATMAKSDTGAAGSSVIVRVGGTDYTSGAKTLSTSYQEFLDVYDTNPGTSDAWSVAAVNALQVGMKVS